MVAWAKARGCAIGTNKAAPDYPIRERVLTDAEVVAIWNAADPATAFGKIIRLLFTTACSEIGGLRGAEIAVEDSLIALPGNRTKNGLPHDVPLSGLAREVVKSLPPDEPGCLFGRDAAGFNNWDRAKQADGTVALYGLWSYNW